MLVIDIFVWALIVLFAVGVFGNFIGPKKIRENYQRWGYPSWFRYVTACVESVAIVLLVMTSTRLYGTLLAAMVMIAATATLIIHREYGSATAPGLATIVALICAANYI